MVADDNVDDEHCIFRVFNVVSLQEVAKACTVERCLVSFPSSGHLRCRTMLSALPTASLTCRCATYAACGSRLSSPTARAAFLQCEGKSLSAFDLGGYG